LLDKRVEFVDQFGSLGGRDPACPQTLLVEAAELDHFLQNRHTLLGGIITVQVIAFTEVSSPDKDPVHPLLESKQNMMRRHTPTAHYPDSPNIRRVLQTTDPSQVSSGVCSPCTQKAYNFRFENVVTHRSVPFSWVISANRVSLSNIGASLKWRESAPAAAPVCSLSISRCGKDRWPHSCRSPCTEYP